MNQLGVTLVTPITSSPSTTTTTTVSSSTTTDSAAAAAAVAAAAHATSSNLATATSFICSSLGTFTSIFKEKHGTPRQGAVIPEARGCLTLSTSISSDSLDGLLEYTHIWLLFVFHQNGNLNTFASAKIKPPRLGGKKIGLFATRSPHRPNPIGMSLAKLDRIVGNKIYVSGIDLIDDTPIIDIKPYHPADSIQDYKIPNWVDALPTKSLTVQWSTNAETELRTAVSSTPGLEFYSKDEYELVHAMITRILEQDPRTLHSKAHHTDGIYGIAIDRLDIIFKMLNDDNTEKSTTENSSSTTSTPMEEDDFSGTPIAAASSSSNSTSSSTAVLPSAFIFSIVYHPPGSIRPRLRTKEWLASIQQDATHSIPTIAMDDR